MCLIVGSGLSVYDDLQKFWDMIPPSHDVCCVNRAAIFYPCEFQHFVSLDRGNHYIKELAHTLPSHIKRHTAYEPDDAWDYGWGKREDNWHGNSGILEVG